jgi:hypothetical protein
MITGELYQKNRRKYTTGAPRINTAVLKFNAALNAADCTEVPLFFKRSPEGNDVFVPSWYELQNTLPTEIVLLHSQPFTASHFHLLAMWSRRAAKCYLVQQTQQNLSRAAIFCTALLRPYFDREFLSHPQYSLGS